MSEKKFYIRFGLHRDRDMLRFLKEDYAGIVLPAHILSYSSKATIAALRYIDKPYFIDPMTYIYADGFLDGYKVRRKEDDKDHLKPSIIKLTNDLGLNDTFPEIDANPLALSDFTPELITKIAQGNLSLQLDLVNQKIESSTPKLDALLAEIGQPPSTTTTTYSPPIFVTAPYFLIPEKQTQQWIDINVKLANETKRQLPKDSKLEVRPIILTYSSKLTEDLIKDYSEFENLIVWVEDLEESKQVVHDQQIKKLTGFKDFIKLAQSKDKKVINLYGSYYSALLIKFGLEAFCNGPLYGEYKSSFASLGGIPPVRVYIPSIHRFYIYSQVTELLRLQPELFNDFPERSKVMFKTIPELAKILGDITLAQAHFINCRNQEIENIGVSDMTKLITDLKSAYDSIEPFEDKPLKGKEPHQLLTWYKALLAEIDNEPSGKDAQATN